MTTIKSKKVCEGHHVRFSTHSRLGNECKACFYYRNVQCHVGLQIRQQKSQLAELPPTWGYPQHR